MKLRKTRRKVILLKHIMMKKWMLSVIVAMAMTVSAEAQLLSTNVAQGEIEGVLSNGFALYKNIPYAEACNK